MTLPRITHVLESSLYVADLHQSEEFYRRLLGLEVFVSDERMRALGVPGQQVLLLFRHGGSAQDSLTPSGNIPLHDARGQQHLCFAIPEAELQAWEHHLEKLGIAIESRLNWRAGAVSLYFRDPDQHLLEVATPGLWPNYPSK
jgi:catechol 2,3-dioxygenase-like lactoylglutathione lyase family enzyme